jgi:hypothetical protein
MFEHINIKFWQNDRNRENPLLFLQSKIHKPFNFYTQDLKIGNKIFHINFFVGMKNLRWNVFLRFTKWNIDETGYFKKRY